jgi:hypothetical protein
MVGGNSGSVPVTEGGGSDRCEYRTAASSSRGYGVRPVRHWNRTHASAYWSVRPSTPEPLICSGAT